MYRIRGPILATAFMAAAAIVGANPAEAHQPYGGCDEAWQAPRSEGANHCREHRWTVTPRVVIGPHGWVQVNRLKPCLSDEGPTPDRPRCYWNAYTMGNLSGNSFVVVGTWDKHRLIFVNGYARR